PRIPEHFERRVVSRRFASHDVAGLSQQSDHPMQGLRAPGRNHHLLRSYRDSPAGVWYPRATSGSSAKAASNALFRAALGTQSTEGNPAARLIRFGLPACRINSNRRARGANLYGEFIEQRFYRALRIFNRRQESGVRSQESEVRSQESGVRSQESGVRKSGVRSQESGVESGTGNPH